MEDEEEFDESEDLDEEIEEYEEKKENEKIKKDKIKAEEKKIEKKYKIINYINRIDYFDEIFKNNISINNINSKYKKIILFKINLESIMVNKIEITPDGNCFYRCVSKILI